MTNIINFPTKKVRGWNEIENTIRKIMKQNNPPQEIVDIVCDRMKQRWYKYFEKGQYDISSLLISISSDDAESINNTITDQVKKTEKQFQKLINELLLEILTLDIELNVLKNKQKEEKT